jgi:hypothetical protein
VFDPLEPRVLLNADILAVRLATMPNDTHDHSVIVRMINDTVQVGAQSQTVQRVEVLDAMNNSATLAIGDLSQIGTVAIQGGGGSGAETVEVDADSFGANTRTIPAPSSFRGWATSPAWWPGAAAATTRSRWTAAAIRANRSRPIADRPAASCWTRPRRRGQQRHRHRAQRHHAGLCQRAGLGRAHRRVGHGRHRQRHHRHSITGGGGGLVGVEIANSTRGITVDTTTEIGTGATFTAGDSRTGQAQSTITSAVIPQLTASGFGAGANVTANITVQNTTTTAIDAQAMLTAEAIEILADVADIDISLQPLATVDAFIGGADATGDLNVTSIAQTMIGQDATLIGTLSVDVAALQDQPTPLQPRAGNRRSVVGGRRDRLCNRACLCRRLGGRHPHDRCNRYR